ncbi:MinD/ParA family protein [Rhodococcus sp. BUPNP1]|uniref:MinD/ParA family ATP-binding protein n=1 Tax=Rhodococcus sp. BUPNP1 TaxID=1432786 RepID=UPI000B5A92C3|nr:MinD/ParA family protein [Rhodococcus sp. BUPNP1]OWY82465.1 ATPase [Rhodococcus sp. BUPNP1]
MRRNEPGPAVPAWLQDPPESGTDHARRGLRRAARGTETPGPSTSPGDGAIPPTASAPIEMTASVPLGMALRPRISADDGPEPEASEPALAHEPARPERRVLPPAEREATVPAVPEATVPAVPEATFPAVPEVTVPAAATEPGPAPVSVDPVPELVEMQPETVAPAPAPAPAPESDVSSPEATEVAPDPVDPEPASVQAPLPATADATVDDLQHEARRFDHQPSNVDLASGVLVRRSRRSTRRWRERVDRLTGGRLDGGGSERREDLVARIRQPIPGDYRIAVLSLKGGVGKTTTTVGLGSTFASLRGDCVIAVDANPDFGTLGQRIPQQTTSTVRDLLANASGIRRYSDVRAHTSQAPSRLEVLASERDPAASEAFSEEDYRRVVDLLQVYYNVILTDCGTGIMHSVMRGVLDLANTLVLVASPAVDAARSAAATLDWLQAHGYSDLVERTVVVISSPRPGAASIDMDALTAHFLARCRAVKVLPFDEHLAEGAEIDLERLRPATRTAFVELAAMVADDFPVLSGRHAVH